MKKLIFVGVLVAGLVLVAGVALAAGGFDQFGYNNKARIFNGPADGVDRVLDNAVWGDPTYANDYLVMKWNAEWDRGNLEGWTDPNGYKAWTDNEWNGNVKGGSGAVWHYKIKWIGICGADYTPLLDGGYCIWGQFEVLMDQGKDPNIGPGHIWFAHANPTGYGN
jgi:hypothetical protein